MASSIRHQLPGALVGGWDACSIHGQQLQGVMDKAPDSLALTPKPKFKVQQVHELVGRHLSHHLELQHRVVSVGGARAYTIDKTCEALHTASSCSSGRTCPHPSPTACQQGSSRPWAASHPRAGDAHRCGCARTPCRPPTVYTCFTQVLPLSSRCRRLPPTSCRCTPGREGATLLHHCCRGVSHCCCEGIEELHAFW